MAKKKTGKVKVVWFADAETIEILDKLVKSSDIDRDTVLSALIMFVTPFQALEYTSRYIIRKGGIPDVCLAEKSPMVLELETKIDYLEYIKKAVEEFKQKLEQYPPEDDIVKMLNDQASAKLETTKGLIHTAKSLQAEQLWNETQYETEGLDFIEN